MLLKKFDFENSLVDGKFDAYRPLIEFFEPLWEKQGHSGHSAGFNSALIKAYTEIVASRPAHETPPTFVCDPNFVEQFENLTGWYRLLVKDCTEESKKWFVDALKILYRITKLEPLSPITDNPAEWGGSLSEQDGVRQNKRLSSLFMEDGKVRWLDGAVVQDFSSDFAYTCSYTSGSFRREVELPFDVETAEVHYRLRGFNDEIIFEGKGDEYHEKVEALRKQYQEYFWLGYDVEKWMKEGSGDPKNLTLRKSFLLPLSLSRISDLIHYFEDTVVTAYLDSKQPDVYSFVRRNTAIVNGSRLLPLGLTESDLLLRMLVQWSKLDPVERGKIFGYSSDIRLIKKADRNFQQFVPLTPDLLPASKEDIAEQERRLNEPAVAVSVDPSGNTAEYIRPPVKQLRSFGSVLIDNLNRVLHSSEEARRYLYESCKENDKVFKTRKNEPIEHVGSYEVVGNAMASVLIDVVGRESVATSR